MLYYARMEINQQFDALRSKLKAIPVDAKFVTTGEDVNREKQKNEAELARQIFIDQTLKRLVKHDDLMFLLREKRTGLLLAHSQVDGDAVLKSDGAITIYRRNFPTTYFTYELKNKKPIFTTNGNIKNTKDFEDDGIFILRYTNYYKPGEYRNALLANEYSSHIYSRNLSLHQQTKISSI